MEAVSFLHQNNFYHRDIKSANFIAKHDEHALGGLELKLCDFGASANSEQLKRKSYAEAHNGAVGTLEATSCPVRALCLET